MLDRRKLTSLISLVSIGSALLLPVQTRADWTDSKIKTITDNVQDIIDTIADAQATIADGKIKAMITDARAMLAQAAATQDAGVSEFLDGGCDVGNLGSECGRFRNDLVTFLQNIEDLNNALLAFHDIPALNLQLEDPGLRDLVEKLPGRALYPLYKVLSKLRFFESGMIDALEDARSHLELLREVVFSDDGSSSLSAMSSAADLQSGDEIDVCALVVENSTAIKVAAAAVLGVGVAARVLGGILEAFSKTLFSGPVEMDGGIHGYVHGTIKQNNLHMFGKGFTVFGEVLSAIASSAFRKVRFCSIEVRQETIIANQETIIANQEEILLGQRRTLCAFKHNLPAQCAEFRGNGFGNRGGKITP